VKLALGGGAGAQAGGAGLFTGAGVAMKRALLDGLVDLRHEREVLGVGRVGIALGYGRLEAPEVRLDGARKETVLGPLTKRAGVALAL